MLGMTRTPLGTLCARGAAVTSNPECWTPSASAFLAAATLTRRSACQPSLACCIPLVGLWLRIIPRHGGCITDPATGSEPACSARQHGAAAHECVQKQRCAGAGSWALLCALLCTGRRAATSPKAGSLACGGRGVEKEGSVLWQAVGGHKQRPKLLRRAQHRPSIQRVGAKGHHLQR